MPGDDEAAKRRYQGYQRVKEARRPDVGAQRLRELARDPVRPVRLLVAQHPATPPDALTGLLADPDEQVVWSALLNRATPAEALAAHAAGASELELSLMAHHPNAPRHLRDGCLCPEFCVGASMFRRSLFDRLRRAVPAARRLGG